jgi:hypothetical protein
MTTQAARDLHTLLRRHPWFATVGQGAGCLVVYVHRMPSGLERATLPASFGGYPCEARYARPPQPRGA